MPTDPLTALPVFDVPDATYATSTTDTYDLYRLANAEGPQPAVVFVPGPAPEGSDRPREWRIYQDYGRLVAHQGLTAAVPELGYVSMESADTAAAWLAQVLDEVRSLPEVDGDRIALWAFSGGGLVVRSWLLKPPKWLRCVGLTYPLLQDPDCGDVPVVLTRVGRERAALQERVTAFLTQAGDAGRHIDLIDVPDGEHSFDMLPAVPGASKAVEMAAAMVAGYLQV